MTTLTLNHIAETPDSTVSELMLDGERLSYIIEDGHREVKVWGETRIPAGRYEIFPRKSGGFFERYKRAFLHKFVLGFRNVPGFSYILIHIGNAPANTHGCLLCNTEYYLGSDNIYRGAGSKDAYLILYDVFDDLFKKGKVFIEIERTNGTTAPADPEPPNDPVAPEPPVIVTPVTKGPDDGLTTPPLEPGTDKAELGFVGLILMVAAYLINEFFNG